MPRPKGNNNRVTTSIKVNPDFWRELKIYCLKNRIEVSEFVEKTLKKTIEPHKNREKNHTNKLNITTL